MREILFRAKLRLGNKWEVGSLIAKYTNGGELFYDLVPLGEDGFTHCNIYQDTIGQFTGLLDRNGTKIFEGDIVNDWMGGAFSHKAVVEFTTKDVGSCGCCYAEFQGSGFVAKYGDGRRIALNEQCVVIGNIHDKGE